MRATHVWLFGLPVPASRPLPWVFGGVSSVPRRHARCIWVFRPIFGAIDENVTRLRVWQMIGYRAATGLLLRLLAVGCVGHGCCQALNLDG